MDLLAIFNAFEAVLWISLGGAVFWKSSCLESRSRILYQRLGQVTAFWFVLFGVSDIFEVFTGAWYKPLSLLVLKAVCIVALIACGITYRLIPNPDRRDR